MQVRQCAPPLGHPATPCVQSFWSVQARRPFAKEVILPKGNVDLLFNLGAPLGVTLADGGQLVLAPGAWLPGLQVGAMASRPLGELHVFGISFAVERCKALLPFPLHEITGRIRPAADVFCGIDLLAERLHGTREFERRVRLLLDWLVPWCEPPTPKARLVQQACRSLAQAPGGAGVNPVAHSLGFTPRHLRRLFLEHVGVTPGHYLKLNRFIRALRLMDPSRSLTDVAHDASYFDQAHFCRDFRDIAGITPGEYRARAGPAVGHLFLF